MKAIVIASLIGLSIAVAPGAAQTLSASPPSRSAETLRSRHIAERNQLGLLQYCHDRGLVLDAAIVRQRRVLLDLPPVPDDTLGATEEAAGREGMIAFGPSRTSFIVDASAQGISLAYNCEQLAARVTAQAAGLY
jgi:hypothetical protein